MSERERESRIQNDQDAREGGYGDDAGEQGADRSDAAPNTGSEGAAADGRDNPGAGSVDADEALGNRAGGYGSAPHGREDQPDGAG